MESSLYYIDAVSFVVASNQVENDNELRVLNSNSVLPKAKSCVPEINAKDFADSATETPTELGVKATKNVCTKLNLNLEEVNLIVGESATPLQVTPSEGQRIAGELNVKTRVFDINSGSSSFGAFLDYLVNLKKDVPKKALWVSANTPTRLSVAKSRSKFSDSGACVSLNLESGAFKIREINYKNNFSIPQVISVNPAKEVLYREENLESFYSAIKEELEVSISKLKNKSEAKLILPNFSPQLAKKIVSDFEISDSQIELGKQANSIGSSFAESLSALLEEDNVNEILIVQAGAGYGIANIILERS